MQTYKTSEIASLIGIHPNTVRLYEELELISKPERQPNGYRVFTQLHLEQFRLARLAFEIEVLQNGLRKKIIQMIKTAAKGEFDTAIMMTEDYLTQLREERTNAEEAAGIVSRLISGETPESPHCFKRKEVSAYLKISMDTLRNWEMNGLLTVKRKKNGYRIYTEQEIQRLKIIRSLRCANYSLESILRMLSQLAQDAKIDIKTVLDTPQKDTEIISVCDQLITSLSDAEQNAKKMIQLLQTLHFTTNV